MGRGGLEAALLWLAEVGRAAGPEPLNSLGIRLKGRQEAASSDVPYSNNRVRRANIIGHSVGTARLCLQAGLQRGSDVGRAVPGGRGAHLLSEHPPGGHSTLSAHSRTPPHPLGPAARATQSQAAGRGILGKSPQCPRSHATLLKQRQPAGSTSLNCGHGSPLTLRKGNPGLKGRNCPRGPLQSPPHPDTDTRKEGSGPSST